MSEGCVKNTRQGSTPTAIARGIGAQEPLPPSSTGVAKGTGVGGPIPLREAASTERAWFAGFHHQAPASDCPPHRATRGGGGPTGGEVDASPDKSRSIDSNSGWTGSVSAGLPRCFSSLPGDRRGTFGTLSDDLRLECKRCHQFWRAQTHLQHIDPSQINAQNRPMLPGTYV